jgi:hypothetical protein
MALASTSSSLTDRMQRAAKLDVHLYEEVEADANATNQALLVVVLVAVASGIGALFAPGYGGVMGLIGGVLASIVGWALSAFVMYFVGTRLFGATATWGELLRTMGFAQTPGLLRVLGFIPVLGAIIVIASLVWTWVAMFIGIRQALDLDNAKTAVTILVGLIAMFVVFAIIGLLIPGLRFM